MELGKDEPDDARKPSVLYRGLHETEEQKDDENQHETAGDAFRIGTALVCRFS